MIELPSKISIETYVLGAGLRSSEALNKIIEVLRTEDFMHFDHARIFSAMAHLFSHDHEVNPDTVAEHLHDKNFKIERSFLYKISTYGVTDDIDYFIEQIKEASYKRRLIKECRTAISVLSDQKQDFENTFFNLVSAVESFVTKNDRSERNVQDILFENYHEPNQSILTYIEKMQELRRLGKTTLKGIPTGYRILNEVLNGFNAGHFIIVGARPSVGKSTFLINLMYNLLKAGRTCLMFSLEMTSEEVMDVIAARESGLDMRSILKGHITPETHTELLHSLEKIRDFKVIIDDSSSLNTIQIKSRIKRYIQAYKPDAIFIDYLTLLSPSGKYSNKQEGIQEISRILTTIAKETRIPIICAAQLNRDTERENRAPRKSDLRESGQIEQDAHSILLLHRPDLEDEIDRPGLLRVEVAKNRFGPCTKIDYSYDRKTAYIREQESWEKEHEEAEK